MVFFLNFYFDIIMIFFLNSHFLYLCMTNAMSPFQKSIMWILFRKKLIHNFQYVFYILSLFTILKTMDMIVQIVFLNVHSLSGHLALCVLQHIWLRVCVHITFGLLLRIFSLNCSWDQVWSNVFVRHFGFRCLHEFFTNGLQQVASRCFLVAQKICPKEKIDGLHTEILPTKRKKLIN